MSRGASAIMTTKASKAASKLKDLEKAEKAAYKVMDKATNAWNKANDRLQVAKDKAEAAAQKKSTDGAAPASGDPVNIGTGDASA